MMITFDSHCVIDRFFFSVSWQSDHFFLKYGKFNIEPRKSKVKVATNRRILNQIIFGTGLTILPKWDLKICWNQFSSERKSVARGVAGVRASVKHKVASSTHIDFINDDFFLDFFIATEMSRDLSILYELRTFSPWPLDNASIFLVPATHCRFWEFTLQRWLTFHSWNIITKNNVWNLWLSLQTK